MTIEIEGFGKITASKEVLNSLSRMADNSYEYYLAKGYSGLSAESDRVANTIYNELKKVNFYK